MIAFALLLAATSGSAPVPASDPAWPALERLCSAGLTGEPCPEIRPLPRARLAAMVRFARDLHADLPDALADSLAQLTHEFLADDAPLVTTRVRTFISDARPVLLDRGTAARVGEERGNEGFVPSRAAARLDARAFTLAGPFALAATAALTAHDAADSAILEPPPLARAAGVARLTLPDATLSAILGNVALTAGRQSISWGAATRGNLLFTDASGGLDLVDVAFHSRFFSAIANAIRLEDSRGHPFVFAQRVSVSPTSFFTLAAQRGILCCENTAGIRAADIPTIFLATRENIPGDRLDFDQIATVSASASLPRAASLALHGLGARAWWEYGGTDLYGLDDVKKSGGFPHLLVASNVAGAFLAAGPVTFTGEYARIGKRPVDFYGNDRYPQGWSWHGLGVGHPAGGRGASTLVAATLSLGAGRELGARLIDERYDRGLSTQSSRRRAGFTWAMPIHTAQLTALVESIEQEGPAENLHGAEATLALRWER